MKTLLVAVNAYLLPLVVVNAYLLPLVLVNAYLPPLVLVNAYLPPLVVVNGQKGVYGFTKELNKTQKQCNNDTFS